VESNWVHSALRPPLGLLCQTRVTMMLEKLVEWWLAGEPEVLGENLPHSHFVHHKPHMLYLGANPGRHGRKSATNSLSYGTALGHLVTIKAVPGSISRGTCVIRATRSISGEWFSPSTSDFPWRRRVKKSLSALCIIPAYLHNYSSPALIFTITSYHLISKLNWV
jgi:hypothetical protein